MNVRRCLRQLVSPTGRHRAPRVVEVNDLAHCPAEDSVTMHAFQGDTRTCTVCGHESPTAVPR